MTEKDRLNKIESLLESCHQLMVDATKIAKDGKDAKLQKRWQKLARIIEGEIKTLRKEKQAHGDT